MPMNADIVKSLCAENALVNPGRNLKPVLTAKKSKDSRNGIAGARMN